MNNARPHNDPRFREARATRPEELRQLQIDSATSAIKRAFEELLTTQPDLRAVLSAKVVPTGKLHELARNVLSSLQALAVSSSANELAVGCHVTTSISKNFTLAPSSTCPQKYLSNRCNGALGRIVDRLPISQGEYFLVEHFKGHSGDRSQSSLAVYHELEIKPVTTTADDLNVSLPKRPFAW